MNEKYAVSPRAFRTPGELNLLLSQFGSFQGRFIAKYPQYWKKLALQHMENLPDGLDKAGAKRRLDRFFEGGGAIFREVPHGFLYSETKNWLKNVLAVLNTGEFSGGVIADEDERGEYPTLAEFQFENTTRDVRIDASADNIVSALLPYLELSERVTLVDPYFDPLRDKYRGVLLGLLQKMGLKDPRIRCRELFLFARADHVLRGRMTAERFDAEVRGLLRPNKLPKECKLSIFLLCETAFGRNHLHNRYFFCERGGLAIHEGFEIRDGAIYLNLIGPEQVRTLLLEYDPVAPQFEVQHRLALGFG